MNLMLPNALRHLSSRACLGTLLLASPSFVQAIPAPTNLASCAVIAEVARDAETFALVLDGGSYTLIYQKLVDGRFVQNRPLVGVLACEKTPMSAGQSVICFSHNNTDKVFIQPN